MEIRAASASAKLRQSNRSGWRIEVTMQLLHSCSAAFFVRRTTDLEKTAKTADYLSRFR